jgi:8-oxo-dGTP pyrophosphatase MutT (NUDIX family)
VQNDPPLILLRREIRLSPWSKLIERTVQLPHANKPQSFHTICQDDSAIILGITTQGLVPVVRQYRPALERHTVELPSGAIHTGETPDEAALRELAEEVGLCPAIHKAGADLPVRLLGSCEADSGRLEAKLWCFLVKDLVPISGWQPEPGIERLLIHREEFTVLIAQGSFCVASHLGVLALAILADAWPIAGDNVTRDHYSDAYRVGVGKQDR